MRTGVKVGRGAVMAVALVEARGARARVVRAMRVSFLLKMHKNIWLTKISQMSIFVDLKLPEDGRWTHRDVFSLGVAVHVEGAEFAHRDALMVGDGLTDLLIIGEVSDVQFSQWDVHGIAFDTDVKVWGAYCERSHAILLM